MTCSQCHRPAVMKLAESNVPVCVEHYAMLQEATTKQLNHQVALLNYLYDRSDEIFGIRTHARIRLPSPIVHTGNTTINQPVNIDRSVIGVVNQGTIDNLTVTLSSLQESDPKLANQLKQLIEGISQNTKITKELKKEVIEQLSFLANQLFTPKEKRNRSVIKTVFQAIPKALSSAKSLLALWKELKPMFDKYFLIHVK